MQIRVVITGLGIIAPGGIGKEAFWETITKGKSAVDEITRFDTKDCPTKIAAEIKDFTPSKYIKIKETRRMDKASQFAIAASQLAVQDSGLKINEEITERTGVCLGTSAGGTEFGGEQLHKSKIKGLSKISPYTATSAFPGSIVGHVTIDLGIKGPSILISTGCTAATDAIGYAKELICSGTSEVILAGGSEAPISPLTLQAFSTIKALSTRNDEPQRASRPFDKKRDGFVLAEGATVFILEELQHALSRNAHIYAELIGYVTTSDGWHITAPSPDGKEAARAMGLAMENANIGPEQIDYISAHGSSTPLNDKTETLVIKKAFGELAYNVPMSSIKSTIGHASGAAGAMQAASCLLTIENNLIPPTINYEFPDPECDLDYVPNKARKKAVKIALQNTTGFGGKNSVLVFKKFDEGKL